MEKSIFKKLVLPTELEKVLENKEVIFPESREDICDLAMGRITGNVFEVAYNTPGKGNLVEATVTRCKNGVSVNYTDTYMRRRDPDCMVVADHKPTDKPKFKDKYGSEFDELRSKTFEWLEQQDELLALPFMAGGHEHGYPAMLVAPSNAGFFAGGLADLQGFIPKNEIPDNFKPRAIIYLAPPFRHTHFDGKQIVVHNRLEKMHELFSYNLYPGPSAKKGIYGVLLNIGEEEGWVTLHASAVKVTTQKGNVFTIMHEGASGGGKSEMIEAFHKESDGRVLLGTNLETNEKFYLDIKEPCELHPITDDMALAPPSIQNDSKKLSIEDAENGWFLRIDHITKYGTEPNLEKLTVHPPEPLIFINIDGKPEASCLIWEHIMDEPGKPCPNPRVIMPRRFVQNTINESIEVNLRSFGVRTPPSSKNSTNYGVIGMFHILPPALAWLWRLVAPRGHSNPSITTTLGMSSEGVGSYWPFATGRRVDQANLLLKQILETPETKYILIPNQHIGVYKVGFMGQWMTREYLSKHGNVDVNTEPVVEARCPILGYALDSLELDGQIIPKDFLQVDLQKENGTEGYDAGAKMLTDFFKNELQHYLVDDLDPLGRKIINICLNDGTLKEYIDAITF
jgi:hypothetical protein